MKVHPVTLPAFGAAIPGQGGFFAAIMRGPVVDGVEQPPYALLVSDAAKGEIEGVEWDISLLHRVYYRATTDEIARKI